MSSFDSSRRANAKPGLFVTARDQQVEWAVQRHPLLNGDPVVGSASEADVNSDNHVKNVAAIYDHAGTAYATYADGNSSQLFDFSGQHSQTDRHVWACLAEKLAEVRYCGATNIRILDAGCGPGTWVRRLVVHARKLGFTKISARGFDISQAQINQARAQAADLAALAGLELTFDVADLRVPLPEATDSVDITLCLYSALNHLPVPTHARVAGEIARVTSRHFITTVRSIGSTPSALADMVENVRQVKHDNARNLCDIEFRDGRKTTFSFHLFSAAELRSHFDGPFLVETMQGLDLFHSRFAGDPRWNPANLPFGNRFVEHLADLEAEYARDPQYIDHANHLLLVGRRRTRSSALAAKAAFG